MRVLIAEDDLTSRDILAALLDMNGYQVILSENGTDAWNIMQQPDPPEIVILDWLMPDLDGLEVCRLVRTLENIHPYIIMLTIMGKKEDIVAGLDTGADDYLSKPYDPGELRARVDVGRRMVDLEKNLAARMKELSESSERFKSIVENVNDIIYTFKEDGVFTYVTPNWTDLVGHDVSEVIGHDFGEFVHPDDLPSCYQFMNHVIKTKKKKSGIEYRVLHKNGTLRWHTTNASIINEKYEESVTYLGVARDITDRKNAEEKIKALLAEKEILLKEVHHRIKNNMNTVMALLSLQAESLDDPSAVAALADAESRVQSMMVLYDKLYRSVNFTELSVKNYLSTLVDSIMDNFYKELPLKVEKELEDFELEAKILQPLGIILNELITNIMKYAFTGRSEGLIKISCFREGGKVIFIIQDNGNGMPENIDFKHSSGFGLQLVYLLSQQINGTIKIERGEGTKIILEFEV